MSLDKLQEFKKAYEAKLKEKAHEGLEMVIKEEHNEDEPEE
jgi:hypothetical protein